MRPGTRFGVYEIREELGRGGMGAVYKARHRVMKREVAIKVIPVERLGHPMVISRFRREIEAPARLSHSNVLTVFDAGFLDGVPFLVSEYLDGGDLARLVKKQGPLPVKQARELILGAADGVIEIHKAKIIHRDLKPSNLLLDGGGAVKVIDFGLAKFLGDSEKTAQANSQDLITNPRNTPKPDDEVFDERNEAAEALPVDGTWLPDSGANVAVADRHFATEFLDRVMSDAAMATQPVGIDDVAGSDDEQRFEETDMPTPLSGVMGTPGFMSPEQATNPRDVDERCDVYGLGATLYYLLTGRSMFPAQTIQEMLQTQQRHEPPTLGEILVDLPRDLEAVYQKMVARRREDRFESVEKAAEALRAIGAQPNIFISYRRDDSIDATDRMYAALRSRFGKESLFLDVDTIPPGVDFRKHLRSAVKSCDIMLVMIGDRWVTPRLENAADFVRLELQYGLELQIPIIPVLVGLASMPTVQQLPIELRDFVFHNAVELRAGPNYEGHIDRLADGINSIWQSIRQRPV